MAWTAPVTWTAGNTLTAAQLNTYWRDNLNTTFVANTTAAHDWAIASAANTISAQGIKGASVTTSQTTTSTSYTDLTTSGPAISLFTSSQAYVWLVCSAANNTAGAEARMSVAVSGATTVAASDNYRLTEKDAANNAIQCALFVNLTGLTSGTNTFTAKYRVTSGTGTFANRHMIVLSS